MSHRSIDRFGRAAWTGDRAHRCSRIFFGLRLLSKPVKRESGDLSDMKTREVCDPPENRCPFSFLRDFEKQGTQPSNSVPGHLHPPSRVEEPSIATGPFSSVYNRSGRLKIAN